MTNDQRIREAGFTIVSRPAQGRPTWQRNGKVVTQKEAMQASLRERGLKKPDKIKVG